MCVWLYYSIVAQDERAIRTPYKWLLFAIASNPQTSDSSLIELYRVTSGVVEWKAKLKHDRRQTRLKLFYFIFFLIFFSSLLNTLNIWESAFIEFTSFKRPFWIGRIQKGFALERLNSSNIDHSHPWYTLCTTHGHWIIFALLFDYNWPPHTHTHDFDAFELWLWLRCASAPYINIIT